MDPVCAAKASVKLQESFGKAQSIGDCLASGGQPLVASRAEGFVADVEAIVEDKASCCSVGSQCFYAIDTAECALMSGTLGAPGTLCDATGACVPPPAAGGTCCEGLDTSIYPGTGCYEGVDDSTCASVAGVFHPNAVCRPSGTCAAP